MSKTGLLVTWAVLAGAIAGLAVQSGALRGLSERLGLLDIDSAYALLDVTTWSFFTRIGVNGMVVLALLALRYRRGIEEVITTATQQRPKRR